MRLLIGLSFFFCLSAWAVDLVGLTRHPLSEIRSHAKTEAEFAREVAASLNRYSSRTQYEACADICRSPVGQWGALPVSIGAHAACSTLRVCPQGMRLIDKTVHSHPVIRHYEQNEVDLYLRNRAYTPGQWVTTDDPALFSDADFTEPGYMVAFGELYYQEGPRKIKRLGSVLNAP